MASTPKMSASASYVPKEVRARADLNVSGAHRLENLVDDGCRGGKLDQSQPYQILLSSGARPSISPGPAAAWPSWNASQS